MLLHDGKESDDNLGGRTDKHLTLSTLLSVVDVVEAIGLGKFTLSHQHLYLADDGWENRKLTRTETRMATEWV